MYTITEQKWLIFSDGFDVIHGPIENGKNNITQTEQPFVVFGANETEVADLFFSEYEKDEYGMITVSTPRAIQWLINYTLQEAEEAVTNFNGLSTNANITYMKHPNTDEYAIPWQDEIFNSLPAGAIKDAMYAVYDQKTADGYLKTQQDMIDENWK